MTLEVSTTSAEAAVMQRVAGEFEGANQALETMLRQLMKNLDLLRSQWVGRGAAAFDQARLLWGEDQAKLHTALKETATAIRNAGTIYSAADDDAATRFKQAGPILPL